MEVIHLSVECFPIAKVGGLADVVGALPKYQRTLGIDAKVVIPWFDRPFVKEHEFEIVAAGSFSQGSEELQYEIHKERSDVLGFPLFLIKIPGKLDREEVYCYPDEAEQWIAFQHAFLHWIQNNGIHPSVIHCHDHHVGLTAFLLQHGTDFRELSGIKTVFTVHNGQYQGWMSWSKGILLPAFDTWKWGLLDWDGLINPLATAIKCSDAYTTVSDGYLNELFIEANGLQGLFNAESAKGYGIVNGIDTAYWNPQVDTLIEKKYNKITVHKGKEENKRILCEKYNLPPDLPLISFIGRFAKEKGADLLSEIFVKLFSIQENISIFILGSGDKEIQNKLRELEFKFEGKLALFFGYDEVLAHQVYAASDMLLMPSRVEPCGLNQLYALKYGTIPIVRAIGGLKDTVIDVANEGYGFVFEKLNADDAVEAIERSLDAYSDIKSWKGIRKKAMQLDFSWDRSAKKYVELYNQLLK
jgi:starch synthase